MIFNKYKVSSYKIIFSIKGILKLELFKHNEKGSNLFIYENDFSIIILQSSYCINKILFEKHPEDFYKYIDNSFFAVRLSKTSKKLNVITDYFGLQTVYYSKQKSELIISPLVYHLNKGVDIDKDLLKEHLIIGYTSQQSSLFKNTKVFKKQCIYSIDSDLIIKNKKYLQSIKLGSNRLTNRVLKNVKEVITLDLKNASNTNYGITSGKDSLALISCAVDSKLNIKTSNFGFNKSGDVMIGKRVSKQLNLSYKHFEYCNSEEFEYFSQLVAFYSSGLTTSSYVDMLKYIYNMDLDSSFVIGEGGECVRNFYKDISVFKRYVTPRKIVESVINDVDYDSFLDRFITNEQSINNFGIKHYRNQRLTGNFSKRHSILSPFINKITPFLNINFINLTYSLSFDSYQLESVHDYLLSLNKSIKDNSNLNMEHNDTQVWEKRIDDIKRNFLKIHEGFDYNLIGLNKEGIDSCLKQMNNNKRVIYFLLRLFTLILFIENVNKSKFESIEKKYITLDFN